MAEVWFYHLERASLEDVLPGLLEKTRERGWSALVCVGSDERLSALDAHLWTYSEESFLAHGTTRDRNPAEQPILLTVSGENGNRADVAFYADGTAPPDWSTDDFRALKRAIMIFDGRDAAALDAARGQWKLARLNGHDVTYWQQSSEGRWEKKA